MKKIMIFLMAAAIAVGTTACAKKGDAAPSASPSAGTAETAVPTAQADASAAPQENGAEARDPDVTPVVPPSANQEVVTKEEAPKVFWDATSTEEKGNLVYHLEGCEKIQGRDVQEVSWELVQSLGLYKCPVCNPPKYEGYSN